MPGGGSGFFASEIAPTGGGGVPEVL